MKKIKITVFLIFILGVFGSLQSQVLDAPTPMDGVFVKEQTSQRIAIPYVHVREADVFWAKRIWRVIDLREKINHILYYPEIPTQGRFSLWTVIWNGLQEGDLTAYDPFDEDFKIPMTIEEVTASLTDTVSQSITRSYPPYEEFDTFYVKTIRSADVIHFRLKEDWFFDKQRSVMEARIIGICPVIFSYDDQGEFFGFKPLFWIHFSTARPLFAKNDVYNRHSDVERRSFDDIFFKRMFGSYIYKESNVYNRTIDEYATGLDALLESERIKNDMFIFEHDLWEY